MKRVFMFVLTAAFTVSGALAQNTAPADAPPTVMVITGGGPFTTELNSSNFFYHEIMRGGEFVKGAPYSATAITETTQTLADGNRIVHKSTAFLARDSEGRTRREETAANFGPLAVNAPKQVVITDPVAKNEYFLNLDEQTGQSIKHENSRILSIEQKRSTKAEAELKSLAPEMGEVKRQSLGTEMIEGMSCDHLLTTQTIPAGAIGNEQPIVITSETWASPELHLLMMRKQSDPRFGETVYRLTDIRRGEPDPSLFQVPPNFKLLDKMPPIKSPME